MLCGGSRASVHLWDHRHPPRLGAKVLRKSSFMLRPCSAISQQRIKSSFRSHCKTPRKIPAPLDCFSQGDDHPELSAEGLSPVAGICLSFKFQLPSISGQPLYDLSGL